MLKQRCGVGTLITLFASGLELCLPTALNTISSTYEGTLFFLYPIGNFISLRFYLHGVAVNEGCTFNPPWSRFLLILHPELKIFGYNTQFWGDDVPRTANVYTAGQSTTCPCGALTYSLEIHVTILTTTLGTNKILMSVPVVSVWSLEAFQGLRVLITSDFFQLQF